ncbi:hypothetical protein [Phenylobacterium sp.]|uniref:hypothetical protein n=1 Tax=Phenylobacterium sp. TaxID=1871053 RepID=UPI00120F2C7F|nr:hypothetical protein [Phenylobacterium sp.]THD60510.1 MAG: hypothetical protein E8A49_13835 [Phenylobacterium sp.]
MRSQDPAALAILTMFAAGSTIVVVDAPSAMRIGCPALHAASSAITCAGFAAKQIPGGWVVYGPNGAGGMAYVQVSRSGVVTNLHTTP